MASAARIHVLEKGKDPRRFSLLAFGGAGPIHAWQTAKLVGSPRIISPLAAGVMSALGFLVTPVSMDFVQTYISGWTSGLGSRQRVVGRDGKPAGSSKSLREAFRPMK